MAKYHITTDDGSVYEVTDDSPDTEPVGATAATPGMKGLPTPSPAGQAPQINMQPQSIPSAVGSAVGSEVRSQARDTGEVAKGVGKGILSTAIGANKLTSKIPIAGQYLSASPQQIQQAEPYTQPSNTAQKIGKIGEQAAEFALPGGALRGAVKGGSVAAMLARSILEGVSAGGVSAVQTGGDMGEAVKTAALGAGTSAGIEAAAKSVPAVKSAVAQILGKTTGAGAGAVAEAMSPSSAAFKQAMRGQTDEMRVLSDAQDALENVKDARRSAYQQALLNIPQNQQLDLTPLRREMVQALSDHGVQATNKGLDFSRSTIRDPAAQNEVTGIVNDINSWGSRPGDLTPLKVDTLKRRIDDFWSPSSNARAFVQRLKSKTRDILNQVPGYQQMTQGYADASDFLDNLRDLSLESKNSGTAIRKLTTTLNQNNGYRQALVDALDQYTNKDLRGQLSGLAMNRLTPRGVMGPLGGAGLIAAIATGHLTPPAAAAMALASPRIMGELLMGMSEMSPAISKAASIAPATVETAATPR